MKIAFIGAGNMAFAITQGIISSNIAKASDIVLYDVNPNQYEKFNKNCTRANSIDELASISDYIFLSIKPQNLKSVLSSVEASIFNKKTVISICAGIPIKTIESFIGNIGVVRAMPNTPLLIGQGVTALCHNGNVSDEKLTFVSKMFSSAGTVIFVEESDINNITAITGSAPAYVYLFIKSMQDAAIKLGFTSNQTTEIICKTFIGASNMVLSTDKTVEELISMVKSPNGTTERALNSFEENNLQNIIFDAMDKCAKRADELSKID